jgi:type IV pilus assembly protein PilO
MAFLDDKPWYYGLAVGAVLAILAIGGAWYYVSDNIEPEIRSAESQIAELDKKIEQGRAAERKLPQFREEVKRLELELEKLRRILPSTRNTEEIIKKIKSLVDQGDFDLKRLTFPKLSDAKGDDPYVEWPISVAVEGRYHNLAILFNRLGNFSRIVNVEQINIQALSAQVEKTITTDFVAKTFVYVEQKEAAAAQDAKNAAVAKSGKPGGK